jgi:hypothetical protein
MNHMSTLRSWCALNGLCTIDTFVRVVKCESELFGQFGAHRYEKEATVAESLTGIMLESLEDRLGTLAAIAPERAESSRESMWALRSALGHGAGWQAMKSEACTESDKGGHDVEVFEHYRSGHVCSGFHSALQAGPADSGSVHPDGFVRLIQR